MDLVGKHDLIKSVLHPSRAGANKPHANRAASKRIGKGITGRRSLSPTKVVIARTSVTPFSYWSHVGFSGQPGKNNPKLVIL